MTATPVLTIAPWGWTVAGCWLLFAAALCVFIGVTHLNRVRPDTGPEPELPPDPVDLANAEPDDIDLCNHCSGTGAVWDGRDLQTADACPVCKGEGILPEYLDVAS